MGSNSPFVLLMLHYAALLALISYVTSLCIWRYKGLRRYRVLEVVKNRNESDDQSVLN